MKLLLDTQIAVWWQIAAGKVPVAARDQIMDHAATVFVSRVSLWEMAIKVSQHKLHIDLPRFVRKIEEDGFCWLGLETEHLLAYPSVPAFNDHKDPFDRLLVAQSLTEPLILLTTDAKLSRYGPTVQIV
jgi:PIN domain nuclease of toxin-antitoxin system